MTREADIFLPDLQWKTAVLQTPADPFFSSSLYNGLDMCQPQYTYTSVISPN